MWGNIGPLEISVKPASIVEENIGNEMLEKWKGIVCPVWCQSGVVQWTSSVVYFPDMSNSNRRIECYEPACLQFFIQGLKSQNWTGGRQNLLDLSCFSSCICTFEGHLTISLRLWHLSNLPQTFYTFIPVDITVIVSFQNHFYEYFE